MAQEISFVIGCDNHLGRYRGLPQSEKQSRRLVGATATPGCGEGKFASGRFDMQFFRAICAMKLLQLQSRRGSEIVPQYSWSDRDLKLRNCIPQSEQNHASGHTVVTLVATVGP
jgi:hypothetical protein